jgi:hypothetical protein
MKPLIFSLFLLSCIHLHAADNVLVWNVVPGSNDVIRTNTFYRLFNQYNRSYLDYWSRNRGIDLAFNQALTTPNIKFVKQGNPNEPVKYGDRVAIFVQRGGYLYYCRRTYGINLCYSSTPVYQWELRDGSYLDGSADNRAAIPNSYIIYGNRTWGPNLKWATTAPPSTTSTKAQVNLSVRTGPYTIHSTTGRCTGRVIWSFTPISLTGSQGTSTFFSIDKFYEVTETTVGPNEIWCIFNDLAIGLKAGRWKIRAQTPVWATECEVSLNNGVNNLKYTQYKNGCTTGIQFP